MYGYDEYIFTSSVGLYCINHNGIFVTQTCLTCKYIGCRRIGNDLIREYTYNNSGLYRGSHDQ